MATAVAADAKAHLKKLGAPPKPKPKPKKRPRGEADAAAPAPAPKKNKKAKAALTDADLAAAKALVAASKALEDARDERDAVCAEVVGETKLQAELDDANDAVSRAFQSKYSLYRAASTRVKAAAKKLQQGVSV